MDLIDLALAKNAAKAAADAVKMVKIDLMDYGIDLLAMAQGGSSHTNVAGTGIFDAAEQAIAAGVPVCLVGKGYGEDTTVFPSQFGSGVMYANIVIASGDRGFKADVIFCKGEGSTVVFLILTPLTLPGLD